jgi:hypothetical protein
MAFVTKEMTPVFCSEEKHEGVWAERKKRHYVSQQKLLSWLRSQVDY